jgi:uncharacterized protein with NRDE domain
MVLRCKENVTVIRIFYRLEISEDGFRATTVILDTENSSRFVTERNYYDAALYHGKSLAVHDQVLTDCLAVWHGDIRQITYLPALQLQTPF